jgi:hypothetical protein
MPGRFRSPTFLARSARLTSPFHSKRRAGKLLPVWYFGISAIRRRVARRYRRAHGAAT